MRIIASQNGSTAPPPPSAQHRVLREFFHHEAVLLLPHLRRYVRQAGLASDREVTEVATDLLQDVVVCALRCAEDFDVSRAPRPWVLGIACNLIKQRRVALAKQRRRSASTPDHPVGERAADLASVPASVFDRLAAAGEDPEHALFGRRQVDAYLACLAENDRVVVQHAVLHGMDGEELAAALHTTPGAARVRLHRALNRLRAAISETVKEVQE